MTFASFFGKYIKLYEMVESVLDGLLFSSVILVALKFRSMNVRLQSARQLLVQQTELTEAYAWRAESHRYELSKALEDLRNVDATVQKLNQNLEQEVRQRTETLLAQDKKIIQFDFINAHQLRAPVARILGLISLLDSEKVDQDQSEIIHRLGKSGEELDDVIHEIQRILISDVNISLLKST